MRLIAQGHSDKEIARQLGLSPRTVRTHLERVYLQRRVKSRASALSEFLNEQHRSESARPPDECPYPRPFAQDFNACPAFQPREWICLDLSDRPLAPIRTCRHLETRPLASHQGRWYGSCRVGDVDAREKWARQVGERRLEVIATLQREMLVLTVPLVRDLWAEKGRQLRDLHAGRDASSRLRQMRRRGERFIAEVRTFLKARQPLLDEIALPVDAVIELIRVSLDHFSSAISTETCWHLPESVLERFPPEIRLFLMPRPPEQGGVASPPMELSLNANAT